MTKGRISSDFPGKTEKNRENRRENLAKINSGDVPQVTDTPPFCFVFLTLAEKCAKEMVHLA